MEPPVFVFDDDCGFCTWWADLFRARADLRTVGFSDLEPPLLERLPANYESCSHLVVDDATYSCGASIEQALLRVPPLGVFRPVIGFLRRFGGYRRVREWLYRRGARNRDRWGRLLSRTPPTRRSD